MIPREDIDRVMDVVRIEDIVGDYVTLRRRGTNLWACCPFHDEKTPSFSVSPAKGMYKCFGCGKAGTAVGFLMAHDALSFPEAIRQLAKRYNIDIHEKEETADEIVKRTRRESLFLVMDYAAKFFSDNLLSGEGRSVGYAYLRSRGLEDETIKKYGLGWAPKSRDKQFAKAAREAGYKDEYLVDTGMCIRRDDGSLADRFYERVMFPIHDMGGRIIAFTGRTLKTDHTIGKYVNSPEMELYHKSDTLYGMNFAKGEISKRQMCYLVEGQMDVLSMHQLGILNVVASGGTALTESQVNMIGRFTKNVTIMYDGDKAGVKAALRGLGMFLSAGFTVKVVLIPDGDDPDSFSRKHTLEEVRDFIATNAKDVISFKAGLLMEEAGNDPIRRAEMINDLADTISLIPDGVTRTVYLQSCAAMFKIDFKVIERRAKSCIRKRLKEEREEQERRERRKKAGLDPKIPEEEMPYEPVPEGVAELPPVTEPPVRKKPTAFEKPLMAPAEQELLWFLYNHGTEPLEFETDSFFYDSESKPLVADFIRGAIEENGKNLENSLYRKAWEEFFTRYDGDDTLTPDDIAREIVGGPDAELASCVAELQMEKYHLSVQSLRNGMTSNSSFLVKMVPKSILNYQVLRIKDLIATLNARLAKLTGATKEEIDAILSEIQQNTKLQKDIESRIVKL